MYMPRTIVCLTLMGALPLAFDVTAAEMRTGTDSTGQHQTEAPDPSALPSRSS